MRKKAKAKVLPPLSADRLREGWPAPARIRIRLARPQDVEAADALMATSGEDMRFLPVLRTAIEDGSASSKVLAGLGASSEAYPGIAADAFTSRPAAEFTSRPAAEAMTTVCLTLTAVDEHDGVVGVLSATAPGTVIDTALNNGYPLPHAMAQSLFIAKVHGLAVAEHTRGQGLATALLKRAWQVYHQLGYILLYGSYEADRDLATFYTRCGWTVLAPGEPFSLERLTLPFRISAGDDQRIFLRWRPRH